MKVLQIAASLVSEWGGPPKVVYELSEHLIRTGVDITIYASGKRGKEKESIFPQGTDCKLFHQNFLSKFWRLYSPELSASLKTEIDKFDLIHIHEIWHYSHFIAYYWAKKKCKPYIITVHGALEPWCLNYKRFKKRVFSAFIQKKILREAAAIHAFTQSEAEQVKAFGINNRIIIIPNGIDLKLYAVLPPKEKIEAQYPQIKGKKMILFLGRIHPIKGLDILAKSISNIAGMREDTILVIAGPDDGYKKQVESMIKIEGISKKVIFTGMITGKEKLAALSRADIFVLPSYSEGFSMSILEAMACGLPVVITNQCHFPEVKQYNAGLVIEPNVGELTEALEILLSDPELCQQMGNNGKRLVRERYTWDRIADQMIEVYKDIIEKNL
ncbi:MAG: glycosyltransferase [Candidatus Lokiarchaeia archaeon]